MKRVTAGLSLIQHPLVFSLLVSSGLSVALWLVRVIGSGVNRYNFMLWNLFLAWLPLYISTWLVKRLARTGWFSWPNLGLTVLWLALIPNSFYMITDLIHLQNSGEINILFDTVLVMSFIFNGLVVGFLSLYQIHRELLRRLSLRRAHLVVAMVLLISSFALYLGRSLRWNSWDIVTNPTGLLFDVSDRIIHPVSYPEAFLTTTTFWMLLGVMYYVCWQVIHLPAVKERR